MEENCLEMGGVESDISGIVEDGTGETEDEELSAVVLVDGAVGETMGLDVEVIMVVLCSCCCCRC